MYLINSTSILPINVNKSIILYNLILLEIIYKSVFLSGWDMALKRKNVKPLIINFQSAIILISKKT